MAELQATQTKVRSVTAGENLAIFGSQLEVPAPRKIGDGGYDDSLVLYGKLWISTFSSQEIWRRRGRRNC